MNEVSASRDASAPFRLPYTFRPERYAVLLRPDLDRATFSGHVDVAGIIEEAASYIVLHAADLSIGRTTLTVGTGPGAEPVAMDPASLTSDAEAETVTIELNRELQPGSAVVVSIDFEGTLNDKLRGFYRSTYTGTDGEKLTLATTQFEATDARRAFPCIDEPDRKAIFSITLDLDGNIDAVSNWPVEIDEHFAAAGPESGPGPGPGRHRVTFADTIPMSTYLVAFVVGNLVFGPERSVRGVPVRIVHVPGKEALTSYALEVAVHAVEFFADWFGIAYPGDKLDLVAIPDFAFGAMENLGCITFRESILLLDPERSSQQELQRAADVIAHEIAHMWFGDLVTMKWWNGIWLNEAFATFMEMLCVDAFRPAWKRWVTFGIEREQALDIDSLATTRPIEYPVGPPEEAQGMFDVITYQKGASVLRMLEQYLGPPVFREGIRRYLTEHAYSSTETSDLWAALEQASGQPVHSVMKSWVFTGGYPLVSVAAGEQAAVGGQEAPDGQAVPEGPAVLAQEVFRYLDEDAAPPAERDAGRSTIWSVPVVVRALGGGGSGVDGEPGGADGGRERVGREGRGDGREGGEDSNGDDERLLLGSEPVTTALPAPLLANARGAGFYRVAYSPPGLAAITARMHQLETLERFDIVSDAWALFLAGRYRVDTLLRAFEALVASDENDPDVWSVAFRALSFFGHVAPAGSRVASLLAGYTRLLAGPVLAAAGFDPDPEEEDRVAVLRAQVIAILGIRGNDPEVTEWAGNAYRTLATEGAALEPDLASAILHIVTLRGGRPEFDDLCERYRHPATPQEENRYLYSLAGFQDLDLVLAAFGMALTEVRTQNAPFLIQQLLANDSSGEAVWAKVTENWEELVDRLPPNTVPRMLDGVKWLCKSDVLVAEIAAFINDHPVRSGRQTVRQIVEKLHVNRAATSRMLDTGELEDALAAGITRLEDRTR